MSRNREPRETFLRSVERAEIFCDVAPARSTIIGHFPAYALHVTTREGLGWYCSRCGERVKVVT